MGNTIEIKGKTYDAVTGTIVVAPSPSPKRNASSQKSTPKHATKPSTTLMRSAVKKPLPKAVHVQTELSTASAPQQIIHPHSASQIDPSRLERAQATPVHVNVKRFHVPEPRPALTTRVAPVTVKPVPDDDSEAANPLLTAPTADIFMDAIAHATHHVDIKSHTADYRRKAHRHYAGIVAGISALCILALYGWYLNSPGLQLRVAGIQAGVATITPNFQNAGFAYAGVKAQDSKRIINLESTITKAHYQLTEEATNWDGGTMIKNISSVNADGSPNYSTLTVKGNTLYKLGATQATWVRNGVWYNLQGTQPIDDDALRALANNS